MPEYEKLQRLCQEPSRPPTAARPTERRSRLYPRARDHLCLSTPLFFFSSFFFPFSPYCLAPAPVFFPPACSFPLGGPGPGPARDPKSDLFTLFQLSSLKFKHRMYFQFNILRQCSCCPINQIPVNPPNPPPSLPHTHTEKRRWPLKRQTCDALLSVHVPRVKDHLLILVRGGGGGGGKFV